MAEWLRRQTRNLLGFSRAGSNPADYETVRTYVMPAHGVHMQDGGASGQKAQVT